MESLHNARPVIDYDTSVGFDWANAQRSETSGSVSAHFGDLSDRLIAFVRESPAIVGCVAWLTHPGILDAIASVPASIVVQKEDFLRPDTGMSGSSWKTVLHQKYAAIGNGWLRYSFPSPLRNASFASSPELDGVRCVGNHNQDRAMSSPRMHHKFLVRVDAEPEATGDSSSIRARAVWTGSFNFSKNAAASFENAVEIHDERIASAYLNEFARVMTLSEPLNWESAWVEPEWRIGS